MSNTITAANAELSLVVVGLFPVGQKLQGFAVEDVYDVDPVDPAEILMGVDGIMSAGFVHVPVPQNFALQASSPSNNIFEEWFLQQRVVGDLFRAQGIITLPSIGRTFIMTNGVLTGYKPMPDAKKVLQPRKFKITWESVLPVPA